ncbi:hypothetical protein D3C85_1834920 [compost metagenome]
MTEALSFSLAAKADELVILIRGREPAKVWDGPQLVGESNRVRVIVQAIVCQHREQIHILFKALNFDENSDLFIFQWLA